MLGACYNNNNYSSEYNPFSDIYQKLYCFKILLIIIMRRGRYCHSHLLLVFNLPAWQSHRNRQRIFGKSGGMFLSQKNCIICEKLLSNSKFFMFLPLYRLFFFFLLLFSSFLPLFPSFLSMFFLFHRLFAPFLFSNLLSPFLYLLFVITPSPCGRTERRQETSILNVQAIFLIHVPGHIYFQREKKKQQNK